MTMREFECIKRSVKTVRVALPAAFVGKELKGITEILDSWKRQYNHQLQGIVVDYKDVKINSQTGFLAIYRPVTYYNVTANFALFCPSKGDIVKGKINRISKDHLGCLIHDTINVSIRRDKTSAQELSQFINLNQEILFEIIHFAFDRKTIKVIGKITENCITLMKETFPGHSSDENADLVVHENNSDSNKPDFSILSNLISDSLHKIKVKSKSAENMSNSSGFGSASLSSESENIPSKSSKHKKSKPENNVHFKVPATKQFTKVITKNSGNADFSDDSDFVNMKDFKKSISKEKKSKKLKHSSKKTEMNTKKSEVESCINSSTVNTNFKDILKEENISLSDLESSFASIDNIKLENTSGVKKEISSPNSLLSKPKKKKRKKSTDDLDAAAAKKRKTSTDNPVAKKVKKKKKKHSKDDESSPKKSKIKKLLKDNESSPKKSKVKKSSKKSTTSGEEKKKDKKRKKDSSSKKDKSKKKKKTD